MSHSYSRDKLEESRRRKRAQQAAQQQRASLPSVNSWRGVTPSQVAKPAVQQTAPKTTVSRPAVQSSASWKGVTPSQVAKPVVQLPTPKAAQTTAVKQPLTFSVGQSLAQRTQQNIRNDNTRRARAARAREGQRQAAEANAAVLKKDRATLAANSLKWHQTSDATERRRLEAANSAIRARRGYSFDSRTGSTYDGKGNELTLAARQIYGGKLADRVESLRQLPAVSRSKDFVRDSRSTASQPSILEAVRGATSDDPSYAIESGRKAHSIVNSLLNRSDETWTDADTKARDEARTALQNEMTALFDHYGKQYQPRWNAEQTAAALRNAGADEGTVAYAMENLRLRDSTDRLGQGLSAVGKRLEASVPSLVDTAKQAISNQSENKENEAFTRLEEQEKQLELQLQNMQSQDENGRVPADYQQVYDQLQRVREEKNALKVTKGVDQNLWSQRMLREANEAQANAEAGLAPAPRWVTEQAISLAANAPTMAASAIPLVGPAAGSIMMGAQAAGQRAFELNEQGKSAGEALSRGTVSGIIEAATEKLPLERMAEILHSGGANAVKNILRQMGTEATEEGVSYFLNYVSDLAAADPNAKFSLAELAQSAAGGAFGGLVFGTAGTVGAKLAQRNEGGIYDDTAYERDVVRSLQDADAQLRAARSLPEGAGREAAVSAAREKMSQTIADFVGQQAAESAERSAAYDADPNGRMSLAQRAQAAAYLNQRTGQADAWQDGQVKPRLGTETEQRMESSYRTPKEENALQSQLAKHFADERQIETGGVYDKETVENYRNQIDGTFDGSLPSDMNISLGQTPKVLQSLGAENLPLRMTQNAARKIAYPDGYMGGKHNLGIPALKHLQEQLNDPIAVLKSKSQHDSFVVLTEWNDTENNPVVAAIHLNKQGVVDDVNMLASAYGKRNLAALLGENNENVIYTKNNKGINQTLDGRLQLPGLLSDDTLVAYSIRQNAGNNNTSSENIPLSEAMQYGKTPEQAVMEARAKREGEQARAQREQTETDLMQSRLADVWSELTELDARGLRHSDEFRDLWDEKNRLNDELAAWSEKTGAVLPEIETPQTDSGEHLDPSIFKYPTQAEEMIRAGANAKRTAGDYLDTLKESRNLAAADTNKQLYHDLLDSYEKVRPIDAELEQARKMTQLSQRDQKLLQSALLGGGREVLSKCENQPGAMRLYDLEVQKREAMKPVNEYNSRVRMEREMQADEWADRIAEFATDKKRGLYYITETPERNTYDIFGKNNRADAEEFNETFYKPVHEAVAEATRLQNRLRDRISGLGLDKHESAMVQMIGEGKKAAALEYAEKHGIKLDSAKETKLNHAVDTFRETYNELFDMINRAEVRNGLEPTRKRENYFPHFTEAAPDTLIARAMWHVGMKITGKETLPTDLAGQTENFRPGHKWERHLQHREGDATIYDAVKGFDQYIEDISQYIYLTDSIQNLRALEDAVRYRLSDEGTRAKIDEIKSNYSIDALERRQMMENTYDATDNRTSFQRAVGALEDQKRAGMRNFVVELRRYTDSLAGKKHRGDRGIEDIVGRDVYEISKNIEGRVAANMISLNPGSWLTNFIPLTQAGEIDTRFLLQGMMDTIRSTVSDDGFINTSTFLTNRYGSDSISKTTLRKISDAAGAPMEMIDHFVAETIVRARVAQNLKNHVMLDEAFSEADSYAASLMADRSKGAMPGAFEMRNPIVKVFTMYQLETNNQLRHFFKDIPRLAQGDFGKAEAVALTKIFAGAYIYNKIYHELTGRDAAFDPIGMIADAFGQLTDDDEDDKKKRALNAATSLGGSVAENLPFIGGVLGGGRVPVSAAIPDVPGLLSEINQGYDSKRLTQDAVKELAKPATYLLLPFGGGAVNRAAQGYMTVKNGGSYRYDKNGEKMLQFPVFGQKPEDWAKAMLFGKSSLDEAQNWKDNGYDSLYAKETEAFDTIREHMRWHKDENGNVVDNSEAAYAAILALRKAEEAAKERHPDNYQDIAATLKRRILMNDKDLSAGQKDFLDRELISGGQSGNYTSQDAFDISQNVREGRQQAANVALKHGISADTFADLDGYLYALTQEQNDDGTKTYTTNTALGKVLEQIEANGNYTAGEKEAIGGYLLITAMSESDKDKYEEEVRGLVNPSDYVRFKSDLAEYQKEFEGTGADHKANIAEILRGYTNLTDEQRAVLMNTYFDTAASNCFHVSGLEKSLADNSLYMDLNDSGRETLRSYCNEYEQAIADGKELDEWKAKAYMAQKEAGISPAVYAMFKVALDSIDTDGGNHKNAELTEAVKLIPGLTDKQRGYLWQAAKGGEASKNNPWGKTTVTAYTKQSDSAVNPVEGGTLSDGFGPRSAPIEGASTWHKAIDIAAPLGTAVRAAMPGKIVEVTKGYNGGYGNTVSVDHGNGIITKYHHMQDGSIDGVSVGQEVTAGQQIGAIGSTGNSSGPHLDFQVVKDGDFVDPRKYIPGYGTGNDYFYSGSASAGAIASGRAAAESSGSSKKSGGSSGGSGGTSWSGLKNLKKPKGLPIF